MAGEGDRESQFQDKCGEGERSGERGRGQGKKSDGEGGELFLVSPYQAA